MKPSTIFWRALELALAALVLSLVYFHRLDRVEWHGDESQWIATSAYFEALFPGFKPPTWLRYTTLDEGLTFPGWVKSGLEPASPPRGVWETRYWTLTQPPMVRYMIAFGRRLAGYQVTDLNQPYDFDRSYAFNKAMGNIPSGGLLVASRQPMALMAVLSGLLLFLLLRPLGAPAAYAFLFFYITSPFLLLHLRRAMAESTLLFFTTLALGCGVLALNAWRRRSQAGKPGRRGPRILPELALLGLAVAAGLAGAAKLNGLLLAAAGAAVCLVMAFARGAQGPRKARLLRALVTGTLVALVAVAVYIAVNPFLYEHPLERTVAMAQLRAFEMRGNLAHPAWGLPTFSRWLEVVPRRVLEDYTVLKFGLINIPLILLGAFTLARSAWRWMTGRPGGTAAGFVILAVIAVTAIPALFTPLDWDRYYMYPVMAVTLLISAGVGQIISAVARRIGKMSPGYGYQGYS